MRRKKREERASLALTECALDSIREIERYSVGRWGRATANKYVDEISAGLDRLVERPSLLKQELDVSRALYFYRVQKHVLVCDYRQDRIVVLAVLHTSMDLPARLAELEPRLAVEVEVLHDKLSFPSKTD